MRIGGLNPGRKSRLHGAGAWLLRSERASVPTLVQARRQVWIHTLAAIVLVLLTVTALPLDGWSDYIHALLTSVLVGLVLGSWRSYRAIRHRPDVPR